MIEVFKDWRVSVFGLLTWLIPFIVSIPFFSPDTGLVVPLLLFKQIMLVTGSLTGVTLLVLVFRRVPPNLATGLTIGAYWLVINWVLDIAILVPMSGGDVGKWFTEIGLGYLSIPFIATGMGMVGGRGR